MSVPALSDPAAPAPAATALRVAAATAFRLERHAQRRSSARSAPHQRPSRGSRWQESRVHSPSACLASLILIAVPIGVRLAAESVLTATSSAVPACVRQVPHESAQSQPLHSTRTRSRPPSEVTPSLGSQPLTCN